MKTEDFKKLQDLLDVKLSFDHENLSTRLMEFSSIHQNLLRILASLTKEKNILDEKLTDTYGKLYKHYKFEDVYHWDTKVEIESQIYSNQKYLSIQSELSEVEMQREYVGKTVDGMKSLSYTLKTYVDYQRLINGAL